MGILDGASLHLDHLNKCRPATCDAEKRPHSRTGITHSGEDVVSQSAAQVLKMSWDVYGASETCS